MAPTDAPIDVQHIGVHLTQHFWSRPRHLLQDVSFRVEPGEIFGFLGANGAGKTTTIKVIMGLLRANSGQVLLSGRSAHDPASRRGLGFMPERAYFPEHLTATELVTLHGILAGLSRRDALKQSGAVLERVGLDKAGATKLKAFSKGMLQRAGLAQALVADPQVVVLDEPMSGLDPLGRRDVRELMLALRQEGKTVFFSTHILPDVELICDRVAMLAGGQLRRIGKVSDMIETNTGHFEVVAADLQANLINQIKPRALRVKERSQAVTFECATLADANAVVDMLRQAGAMVHSMQAARTALEETFMQVGKTS